MVLKDLKMALSLSDAQARYDAILKTLGITETEFQSRRMQYSSGDARLKELAFLEEKIEQLTAQASGSTTTRSRCTLATFRRD